MDFVSKASSICSNSALISANNSVRSRCPSTAPSTKLIPQHRIIRKMYGRTEGNKNTNMTEKEGRANHT